MILLFVLLSSFYIILLFFFTLGVLFTGKRGKQKLSGISVIIAARNEEQHLPYLIDCLLNQDYPREFYEIILVDDRSTDSTPQIISRYANDNELIETFRVEDNNSVLIGKKKALDLGIKNSRFEILAFTDADCLPARGWLREINTHFLDQVDFVAGYSPLIIKKPILSLLKNLERASIFAVTAGSFGLNWGFTCAARNIAYRKKIYLEAEGFSGIGHIRSGDDDLFLQKTAPLIRRLNFMLSTASVVPSHDKEDVREQLDLESRRASKWKYYPPVIKLMTFLVFFYYLILLAGIIQLLNGQFPSSLFLEMAGGKIMAEFLLLAVFLVRIKKIRLLLVFPLAEIIYLPYFLYFSIKGTFGKYRWRD